jgi:hypothetical protein
MRLNVYDGALLFHPTQGDTQLINGLIGFLTQDLAAAEAYVLGGRETPEDGEYEVLVRPYK